MEDNLGLVRKGLSFLARHSVPQARHPVELLQVALHYETEARLHALQGAEHSGIRYSAFWRFFRGNSIRAVLMQKGDHSEQNRYRMAENCIQMSAIILDIEQEGERIVLPSDPTFAEHCAQSAYGLVYEEVDGLLTRFLANARKGKSMT